MRDESVEIFNLKLESATKQGFVLSELLDTSFKYPAANEYDPAIAFRDSIGIWGSSIEPVRVRVRLASN